MIIENAIPEIPRPTKKELLMTSFSSCPPLTPFSTVASLVLLVGLIYGSLWGLIGKLALPGGPIFALFALVIVSYLGGQLIRLLKVPTLVGMMVLGFVLRNAPHINIANDIPEDVAGDIRNLALVLILLRAGLEVDADVLSGNKATCSKLILIPFVVECCTGAIASHYLLDLPWIWGFLLGFMLAAVSPAVVLPVMLKLQKKGIGVTNGIPTMVIAVAGIDDVLAVTGFEVLLGMIFSTGNLGWTIAQGPLQVIVGIIYGVLLGFICWYIPNPEEKNKSVLRFMILSFGGMFILYGSQAVDWGAAGALGCICLPFVAAIRWKKKDWDEDDNPVADALAFVWRIIEPFLFGLIGSEIRIDYLQPSIVGLGLATLFIALALRMVASLVAAFSAGLSLKEQIFVTFAGLPKATVQAAIGPVALAYAKLHDLGPEIEDYGIKILTVAVLSILITAPIGATAISLLAPRLLDNSNNSLDEKEKAKVPEVKLSIVDNNDCIVNKYSQKRDSKLLNFSSENSSNVYTIARL